MWVVLMDFSLGSGREAGVSAAATPLAVAASVTVTRDEFDHRLALRPQSSSEPDAVVAIAHLRAEPGQLEQ